MDSISKAMSEYKDWLGRSPTIQEIHSAYQDYAKDYFMYENFRAWLEYHED